MVVVRIHIRIHICIDVLGCQNMVGGDTVINQQLINECLLNTTILNDGECKNAADIVS
jgi:hypothetical protein